MNVNANANVNVSLAYGRGRLDVTVPAGYEVTVLAPDHPAPIADARAAIADALAAPIDSAPLRQRAAGAARVGIVVNDITRATPYDVILPPLLAALGLPDERLTIFVALGTHRPCTDAELRALLGEDIVRRLRIVQNDAFDPAVHADLGLSARGNRIRVHAELCACDLRVLTGFIEPHFFAGFSGGAKALMPGMAALETVLVNHGPAMVGHERAAFGLREGNPIAEEIDEVAERLGDCFLLNVTLDDGQHITGVYAGDVRAAHAAGCEAVRASAMVAVPEPFDVVVTSNSGYPLDLNLYQTVKGMRAAARVVRPAGTIIAVSSCWDGIPAHGRYAELLVEAANPRELLERVTAEGFCEQDGWEAHVQALVQLHANVYLYSDNLDDATIYGALLEPCRDVEATLAALLARHAIEFSRPARVCLLPEGPQTIPYLADG